MLCVCLFVCVFLCLLAVLLENVCNYYRLLKFRNRSGQYLWNRAVRFLQPVRGARFAVHVSSAVSLCCWMQDVGRASEREPSCTGCPYKTDETLVLYDQCSRSVADDVAVSTSQVTSYHVVSVLLRRLKQDGFRVYLLDGKPTFRPRTSLFNQTMTD